MRIATLGGLIDVTQYAKTEFGIFVQQFARVRYRRDARLQIHRPSRPPDQRADLLAPLDTRIPLEDAVTFRRKAFEAVYHFVSTLYLV
jgi:hypothetical protein